MSTHESDDYFEELRVVRGPRGTHRTRSHGTPGFDRDLLRDEAGVRGPTESRPVTAEDLRQHRVGSGPLPSSAEELARDAVYQLASAALSGLIDAVAEAAHDPAFRAAVRQWWAAMWARVSDRVFAARRRVEVMANRGERAAPRPLELEAGRIVKAAVPSEDHRRLLEDPEVVDLLLRLLDERAAGSDVLTGHGCQHEIPGDSAAELKRQIEALAPEQVRQAAFSLRAMRLEK